MTESEKMRRKTRWFMLGAFVVAGAAFALIAATSMSKNLVYYWTPADLHKAGDKAYGATIRLGGMVAPGSIKKVDGVSAMEFDVKDGGHVVHVKSAGVPPQMFRENIGVVVEGTMDRGGYFKCNRLMVSHNNEYRAPKPGHPVDEKQMKKYIEEAQ